MNLNQFINDNASLVFVITLIAAFVAISMWRSLLRHLNIRKHASYYDMWCVRRIHERKFGQGFHMNNGKEAQALTDLLNENEVA